MCARMPSSGIENKIEEKEDSKGGYLVLYDVS